MQCPRCKGETLDCYYCIICGKKLKDFKRFEIKFAIHTTDKNASFDWEKIYKLLSGVIEGDIANLSVEEVKPADY